MKDTTPGLCFACPVLVSFLPMYKRMYKLPVMVIILMLPVARASGQTTSGKQPDSSRDAAGPKWSFSAYAYTYVVPHSQVFVNPNFTADRGRFHFEARYNYEAQQAGSLWTGFTLKTGDKLVLEVTPMLGCVFGKLNGVAPGYNLALDYGRFSLSSQGEYVFDFADRSGNFFYTWSELAYSPVEWFRAGMAVQRTKAYKSEFDIQRGLFAGLSRGKVDITTYVFNFGWTEPTVVVALGLNF
jgi:hypothetical protein